MPKLSEAKLAKKKRRENNKRAAQRHRERIKFEMDMYQKQVGGLKYQNCILQAALATRNNENRYLQTKIRRLQELLLKVKGEIPQENKLPEIDSNFWYEDPTIINHFVKINS